ncbi:MAG TPA: VWA domain-containing protein [Pyrinomonadaceae bacterium]|nr:VWA domain-containing protein [Pyrinomonadaceae bacterium]
MSARIKFLTPLFILLFSIFANAQSGRIVQRPTPTPTPDDTEKIFTEEVKLNILAFDENGKFYDGAKAEDVVITENNIIHQASSLRRIPANVLIVMDTGGEMRQKKSLQLTRNAALSVVKSLKDDDQIAVLQYSDKAEILAEWTNDKTQIVDAIKKKSNFGRRSAFVAALDLAEDFMRKNPLDNKHLVLITDGTDSLSSAEEKAAALRKILATDINVHVISYTKMETDDVAPRTKMISNSPPKKALPPEVAAGLPNGVRDVATAPKIGPTINLDRAMQKKLKERKADLEKSEKQLQTLAENTNGEFILPLDAEEMLEKGSLVARMIDSSYVVTYIPKRPLSESARGEERDIVVTSRRDGLLVEAKRKLIVKPEDSQ